MQNSPDVLEYQKISVYFASYTFYIFKEIIFLELVGGRGLIKNLKYPG